MPDQQSDQSAIDFEKRVRQFVAIRDLIAAKTEVFNAEVADLKKMRDALGGVLLGYLRKTRQLSARTEAGTVSISEKDSATVEDAAAFRQFCIERDWSLADLRANASRVRSWMEEHKGDGAMGPPPPGVKFSTWVTVGVRRS